MNSPRTKLEVVVPIIRENGKFNESLMPALPTGRANALADKLNE